MTSTVACTLPFFVFEVLTVINVGSAMLPCFTELQQGHERLCQLIDERFIIVILGGRGNWTLYADCFIAL